MRETDGENAESAFNRPIQENTSINTHSEKLQQMLKSKECVEKINEARQAREYNAAQPQPVEEDDGPQVVGEAREAMNDVLCLQQNDKNKGPSLEELVSSLNADQSRVFERVKLHLMHENGGCKCTDFKPLHIFVSGVGGTGKSFHKYRTCTGFRHVGLHSAVTSVCCYTVVDSGGKMCNVTQKGLLILYFQFYMEK